MMEKHTRLLWSYKFILSTRTENGGNAQLEICYGVGHNAWDYAYTDDFLMNWMLEKYL